MSMSRPCRWRMVAAGLAAALAGGACPALAQSLDELLPPDVAGTGVEPAVTVLSRSRAAYDALGVRLGTFLIRPNLNESVGYESNVLGTTSPRGGPIIETTGSVTAVSEQSRADVNASITVDDVRYPSQPTQSFTNITGQISGDYQIGRDILSVAFQHLELNQTVRDLDIARTLSQALPYHVDDGRLAYRVNFARAFVVPAIEVASYRYDNGISGGLPYLQNYRDRTVVQPSVTLGYELAPRRSVVAVVRNAIGSYPNPQSGGASRDYNDTTILGGLDYDLSGALRFRALAGYEVRSFQSGAYRAITAPVLEAAVIWNPTGLTTLSGGVSRRITDSSDQSTAAVTRTDARVQLDHEYARNVLLQASGGVQVDQYTGASDQVLYVAGVRSTYLANRNATLTLSYDFQARRSGGGAVNLGGFNQPFGPDYDDHRLQLQLRLRL